MAERAVAMKALDAWSEASLLSRLLITSAGAVSVALTWGLARMFGVPGMPASDVSILGQSALFPSLVGVLLMVMASTVVGTLIAGRIRSEAGVFCGAIALAILSTWFGTMRQAFFYFTSPANVMTLLFELCFLFALLVGAAALSRAMRNAGIARPRIHAELPLKWTQANLLATLTHVVVMIILLQLLAATDRKAQAWVSALVASFVGGVAAQSMFPTTKAFFLWIAPLIVGCVAYGYEMISPSGAWTTGVIEHPFARLIPLDYAGPGVAGAILAFWASGEVAPASTTHTRGEVASVSPSVPS